MLRLAGNDDSGEASHELDQKKQLYLFTWFWVNYQSNPIDLLHYYGRHITLLRPSYFLQALDRKVGVISHVTILVERIGAKVVVEK
jgi:hypothetical protein